MSPHPWRELRALAHVVVHHRELHPSGTRGVTDGVRRIWLDSRLTQVERRCTLAHELVHIKAGHTGCQPTAVEARVEAAAARYLLPDAAAIGDALVWARGRLPVAADELWVDVPTLTTRLDDRWLTATDRDVIRERIARLDLGA